ncbi:protein of unknown function [Azospirillum baldaniorum]|uniref:Uncharacterized protein n=1 Tax=Azospirillum baldaniorum TaxID=1064539 RepID=A0A9P1JPS6_9PROT|nr:protein of unknown function [Azospirillum baldaniorum]
MAKGEGGDSWHVAWRIPSAVSSQARILTRARRPARTHPSSLRRGRHRSRDNLSQFRPLMHIRPCL